jgi:hypothetical protein
MGTEYQMSGTKIISVMISISNLMKMAPTDQSTYGQSNTINDLKKFNFFKGYRYEKLQVTYRFKCEHCFKECEYTVSDRMIHAAVGPELQNNNSIQFLIITC